MEAMACGCAVVVTPTGFGSDLRDCVDAVVCDFLDEERMQAQILSLLSDDARRIRIARAAARAGHALGPAGGRTGGSLPRRLAHWDCASASLQ